MGDGEDQGWPRGGRGAGPGPGEGATPFASLLYGRVAAEDLARHAEDDLARYAAHSLESLAAARAPGACRIVLRDERMTGEGARREFTVVEIVNDNMPFLLDSALAELAEQGVEPLLVAHPILAVARDEAGVMTRLAGDAGARPVAGTLRESLLHIHVEWIADPDARARLEAGLARVFADVRLAVSDWPAMRARLLTAMAACKADPPPVPEEQLAESLSFLEWIGGDNFTFLGMREYRYGGAGQPQVEAVEGSGLGILRDPATMVLRRGREMVAMTPEIQAFLERPEILIITKANVKSRVHRRVHLDYVGVKLFTPDGRLKGS